jgi:hypothetical protein
MAIAWCSRDETEQTARRHRRPFDCVAVSLTTNTGQPSAGDRDAAGIICVRGVVQGVGFRPTVWRLARRNGLRGWVANDGDGVIIRVRFRSGDHPLC